jgi:hypothetical protein
LIRLKGIKVKPATSNQQPPTSNSKIESQQDRFGPTNWLLLGGGLLLLVVGFVVLATADERAANLAGRLAPFLILGAYAIVFIGLIYRSSKSVNS